MTIDLKLFILIGIIFILYVFIKCLFNYLNNKLKEDNKTLGVNLNKIDREFWLEGEDKEA